MYPNLRLAAYSVPSPGMDAEEGVGGLHQVLPAHEAGQLPGAAAAAGGAAGRRVRRRPGAARPHVRVRARLQRLAAAARAGGGDGRAGRQRARHPGRRAGEQATAGRGFVLTVREIRMKGLVSAVVSSFCGSV